MGTIPAFVLDRNIQHAELREAEAYTKSHGGLLPDDPFWRYVEQRFNEAVSTGHLARFEHYHPVITPLLEGNLEALSRPVTVAVTNPPSLVQLCTCLPAGETSNPGVVVSNPSVPSLTLPGAVSEPAPSFVPAAVPEPASALLFGLGMVAVIVLGRKLRR